MIAEEGLFDKFSNKNPEGMSDFQVIAEFLDINNLLNKNNQAAEKNANATAFQQSIIKEYDNDPARIMAGIEWKVHGISDSATGLKTWYITENDIKTGKIKSLKIYSDFNKYREFKWRDILRSVKNNKK